MAPWQCRTAMNRIQGRFCGAHGLVVRSGRFWGRSVAAQIAGRPYAGLKVGIGTCKLTCRYHSRLLIGRFWTVSGPCRALPRPWTAWVPQFWGAQKQGALEGGWCWFNRGWWGVQPLRKTSEVGPIYKAPCIWAARLRKRLRKMGPSRVARQWPPVFQSLRVRRKVSAACGPLARVCRGRNSRGRFGPGKGRQQSGAWLSACLIRYWIQGHL